MSRAQTLIETLNLAPHPERGYFVETYRAPRVLEGLADYSGPRNASTAIYFLLTAEEPSSYLHRLRTAELFHHYEGCALDVHLLREGEPPRIEVLGTDVVRGERPQIVIPAGTWFAATVQPPRSNGGGPARGPGDEHAHERYCLFGCTVAPGFDFEDFELAVGPSFLERFPGHTSDIRHLVRGV